MSKVLEDVALNYDITFPTEEAAGYWRGNFELCKSHRDYGLNLGMDDRQLAYFDGFGWKWGKPPIWVSVTSMFYDLPN